MSAASKTVSGSRTRRPAFATWVASLLAVMCGLVVTGCGGETVAADSDAVSRGSGVVTVGLITKTDQNPFFVAMADGAAHRAAELGVELHTFAGAFDGDWETQAAAVDELVALGAHGILITPSDPAALAPVIERARGRGVLVISLDTPFEDPETVDGTFATDNFAAGELIGRWAKARMEAADTEARIVTLDGYRAPISVDVLRNQGFLQGFGVDLNDAHERYDEDDPRLVTHGLTAGTADGGRDAMAALLAEQPSVNVVYAINEPAAAGAHEALDALGLAADVLIVTIDGGCEGVRSVAAGAFGATAMQFPLDMARLGVDAVVDYVTAGTLPEPSPGRSFRDTGTTLVTDQPVSGIESITAETALEHCWGEQQS